VLRFRRSVQVPDDHGRGRQIGVVVHHGCQGSQHSRHGAAPGGVASVVTTSSAVRQEKLPPPANGRPGGGHRAQWPRISVPEVLTDGAGCPYAHLARTRDAAGNKPQRTSEATMNAQPTPPKRVATLVLERPAPPAGGQHKIVAAPCRPILHAPRRGGQPPARWRLLCAGR
jgi:hypothetical protein